MPSYVRGTAVITNLESWFNERLETILGRVAATGPEGRIHYQAVVNIAMPPNAPPTPLVAFVFIMPGPLLGTTLSVTSKPVSSPTTLTDETLENIVREALTTMWKERDRQLAVGNGHLPKPGPANG